MTEEPAATGTDLRSAPPRIVDEPVRGGYPDPRLFGLSGIEQMRAFFRGLGPRPPMHYLTGLRPTEVGLGSSTFVMPATEWLLVPNGVISGGTLAVLADGPLGVAVQTTLPPATGYATAQLAMNFLRPAFPGPGNIIARGRVTHGGRSLALSETTVEDAEGKVLAHGSSRCVIFPPLDVPPPDLDAMPVIEEPAHDSLHPYERPVLGSPVPQETWDRLSGLEVLQAALDGELPAPPIYHLTGLHPVEVDEGQATFVMPATGWHTSPIATVEGGFIALLADSALACAVQTTLPAGTAYATIDLVVNFLRPVHPDGRDLTARGTVAHRGRSIAVANAEVTNAEGKRVARASGTAMILPGRPAALIPSEEAVPGEREP